MLTKNLRPALGVCVVTYQERFADSNAFASLSRLPQTLLHQLRVVSVCNSTREKFDEESVGRDERCTAFAYREILRKDNPGLAGGYNSGLAEVLRDSPNAVLFLNADADLAAWYVEWLLESLTAYPEHNGFAPTLLSRQATVSPFRKRGIPANLYIIGYLCLRNSPFLHQLQFPDEFWLDGIDYWLSVKLAEAGHRIKVNERTIVHNLSVSDQFGTLPSWRYRNILISERRFLKWQGRPFLDVCIVYARALARCLRHGRFDLARVVAREFSVALHE